MKITVKRIKDGRTEYLDKNFIWKDTIENIPETSLYLRTFKSLIIEGIKDCYQIVIDKVLEDFSFKKIKCAKVIGDDDGFYWDFYIVFEYKGETYTINEAGSGSGWIPEFHYACKGEMNRLFGEQFKDLKELEETDDYTNIKDNEFLQGFEGFTEAKLLRIVKYLNSKHLKEIKWEEGDDENSKIKALFTEVVNHKEERELLREEENE